MPLKPLKLTLPTLSLTPLAAVHRRAYRGLLAATITLGSAVVALPSPADTGHHHAPAAPSHAEPHQQHHQTLEIPEEQPLPTVSLIAHPDPVRGWNLEIQTTNFAFAPERVNQAHQLGKGMVICTLMVSTYLGSMATGCISQPCHLVATN